MNDILEPILRHFRLYLGKKMCFSYYPDMIPSIPRKKIDNFEKKILAILGPPGVPPLRGVRGGHIKNPKRLSSNHPLSRLCAKICENPTIFKPKTRNPCLFLILIFKSDIFCMALIQSNDWCCEFESHPGLQFFILCILLPVNPWCLRSIMGQAHGHQLHV